MKEIEILGKRVVIENTEDDQLVARMIDTIKRDIKLNIKQSVIISNFNFYDWYIKDDQIINFEDLTEKMINSLSSKSKILISMESLNKISENDLTLMMIGKQNESK